MNIEEVDISIISVSDLIKNKKASGRSMDIADAERLEKQNEKTR